jgi:glycosyltransferase involved in cell wall biosynthesis
MDFMKAKTRYASAEETTEVPGGVALSDVAQQQPHPAHGRPPVGKPRRACMLSYSFYESDGRVMRYAEALASVGVEVDAIAIGHPGQAREELLRGVRVIRVQSRRRDERGRFSYFWRLLTFFFLSAWTLTVRHLRAPYGLVHVHSVPDFEVFAALVPKIGGASVILDIHDLVPELYATKFGVSHGSVVFRALCMIERASCAFADHVIAANDLWFQRLATRSTHRSKCSSFLNYPDPAIFGGKLGKRAPDGRFVVIYPGSLQRHQGLDLAIKALALIRADAPTMELHIYGDGPTKPHLEKLAGELGLQDKVIMRAPMQIEAIARVMAHADLGVVPKRNDGFGDEAFSTKVLEFMAVGVPLVVAATTIDKHYFNTSLVRFFAPGDEHDQLLDAYHDRERNSQLAAAASKFVASLDWSVKKRDYLGLVERLTDQRTACHTP